MSFLTTRTTLHVDKSRIKGGYLPFTLYQIMGCFVALLFSVEVLRRFGGGFEEIGEDIFEG